MQWQVATTRNSSAETGWWETRGRPGEDGRAASPWGGTGPRGRKGAPLSKSERQGQVLLVRGGGRITGRDRAHLTPWRLGPRRSDLCRARCTGAGSPALTAAPPAALRRGDTGAGTEMTFAGPTFPAASGPQCCSQGQPPKTEKPHSLARVLADGCGPRSPLDSNPLLLSLFPNVKEAQISRWVKMIFREIVPHLLGELACWIKSLSLPQHLASWLTGLRDQARLGGGGNGGLLSPRGLRGMEREGDVSVVIKKCESCQDNI